MKPFEIADYQDLLSDIKNGNELTEEQTEVTGSLYDKLMDNDILDDREQYFIREAKTIPMSTLARQVYEELDEEDAVIIDFNPEYFESIDEKHKVMAVIRGAELV